MCRLKKKNGSLTLEYYDNVIDQWDKQFQQNAK